MKHQGFLYGFFFAALFSLANPLSAQPGAESTTPLTLEALQDSISFLLDQSKVQGIGLSLVTKDTSVLTRGFGYKHKGQPDLVAENTKFRVGSLSKSFIAAIVIELSLEGKINLEDPISKYVPEVEMENPWAPEKPVKIIHLLEHTAGFDDMHFNEMYIPQGTESNPELEMALAQNPNSREVRWMPGSRFAYSNPGYALLGYLIEKVEGLPFEVVVGERIFLAAGMESSFFSALDSTDTELAHGHSQSQPDGTRFPAIWLRPAGSLVSTPADLSIWTRILLNEGRWRGREILKAETVRLLQLPESRLGAKAGLVSGYAKGLSMSFANGQACFGHRGSIKGFEARYLYSPHNERGFALLMNDEDVPAGFRQKLYNWLEDWLTFSERKTFLTAGEALGYWEWEGYYMLESPRNELMRFATDFSKTIRIVATQDSLKVIPFLGEPYFLLHTGDNLFQDPRKEFPTGVAGYSPWGEKYVELNGEYFEQKSAVSIMIIRVLLFLSFGIMVLFPFWGLIMLIRGLTERSKPGAMKVPVLGLGISGLTTWAAFAGAIISLFFLSAEEMAVASFPAIVLFLLSLLFPLLTLILSIEVVRKYLEKFRKFSWWATASFAFVCLFWSAYFFSYGLIGIRLWAW